ncbi:MAG: DUF4845 domain-containing protein [Pseudomonadota bacterium]|nr:DUF4845 domain-containing protein [Pseudomonadota bacterium]
MKHNTRHAQQGMTLIGFLIVLAVAGFGAYIGMKLFPMYQEFFSVKSSLKGLSDEPGMADQTPEKIQDLFFRRLYINYSANVKPEHVKLTRSDRGWKMDVNYEVRKPLIYNLDVVGKFTATQELNRGGADD